MDAAHSRSPLPPHRAGRHRRAPILTASAGLLLAALAAQASGRLPPLPMEPQRFASYAACKAHLQQRHREDSARADARPRPVEAGGSVQTVVSTDGVVEAGRRHARYRVQIGWLGRDSARNAIDGMIQTQYSYEETLLECKGRTLTGETVDGYHSPGYEPVAPEAAPEAAPETRPEAGPQSAPSPGPVPAPSPSLPPNPPPASAPAERPAGAATAGDNAPERRG